jgi:hypothetical protein
VDFKKQLRRRVGDEEKKRFLPPFPMDSQTQNENPDHDV